MYYNIDKQYTVFYGAIVRCPDLRELLRQNNKIELKHLLSGGKEVFKINSVVGQGGACVVYSATRNNRKGILKEFYPLNFKESCNNLKRTRKNQLVASGDEYIQRFEQMCTEFKEGYDLLEKVNFESGKNLLSNYVPEYEIYVGTEENSTIYIWTKHSAGVTFKSYIADVWKNPGKNPEFNLYNLLTIIKSIALGVCGMHVQGLMHRDIKPDNFLIAKDGMNNINPYQVSMFDINSFCYGTSSKYIIGTEGYTAPEVKRGQCRYYSDIYSLGAVLYNSVADGSNCYTDENYCNLEKIIDESKLLCNMPDIYIKAQLVNILRKSLAERPTSRYFETELFIKDLDKVIVRLLPHTIAKKIPDSNQRFRIIEERKAIDAVPVFQDLLFKYPVFKWFDTSEQINILVVGGGLYAQAFMDVILPTLQLKDKTLNVTVATESPEFDKAIYLKARPDLERFFDVDKKFKGNKALSYGSINFIPCVFEKKEHSNDISVRELINNTNPCYVLVSLGDDNLNNSVAKTIADTNVKALVNFVWSGEEQNFKKGNPVYINKTTEYKNIHENLLQMAFNTHLTWSDCADADIDALYSEFKKIYNFKNSIAFALSIQYKLYSMGLSLDEVKKDLTKISFANNTAKQEKIIKELSWAEHKRWTADKITSGWRAPLNESGQVDTSLCLKFGSDKSAKEKLHLCITQSTPDDTPDSSQWDSCNVNNLDELDRVSVEMYRYFKLAANELKKTKYIEFLRLIEKFKSGISLYGEKLNYLSNEFEIALTSIVDHEKTAYLYRYGDIERNLKKEIEKSAIPNKDDILYMLKELGAYIHPIIMANKKTDYKYLDRMLVENMAYIIGNRPRPKMAVFLNDGRFLECSDTYFYKNVASSRIIIPGSIKYMYYYTFDTDISRLTDTIRGILMYFSAKNMKHRTSFVFVSENKMPGDLKDKMDEISGFFGTKVKYYENVGSCKSAVQIFYNECKNNYITDVSTLPFDNVLENEFCARKFKDLCHFSYDVSKNKICNANCDYLNYLNTSGASLTVSDLFTLKNDKVSFANPDMRLLYNDFWSIYTNKADGNTPFKNYNSLSEKLNDYSKTNNIIASFDNGKGGKIHTLEKIMPVFCYENCRRLAGILLKNKVLTEFDIRVLNKDTFKLKISYSSDHSKIPRLFSNYNALSDKSEIGYMYTEGRLQIFVNSILVKGVVLNTYEYNTAKKLSDAGFINELTAECKVENSYCVSFCYASESIRKMICTKDAVLKTYVYYTLLAGGNFDDLKPDVSFGMYSADLIITKNNRSVFVVFDNSLKDFKYNTLEFVKAYGINSILIFISDCCNCETGYDDFYGFEIFNLTASENTCEEINAIIKSI